MGDSSLESQVELTEKCVIMGEDKKIQEVQDQANANLVVKSAQGFIIGVGASAGLLVLSRFRKFRTWPIIFGTGAGVGQGLTEKDFAYNAYCYEHGMDISKLNGTNCTVNSDDCAPMRFAKCMLSQVKRLTGQN